MTGSVFWVMVAIWHYLPRLFGTGTGFSVIAAILDLTDLITPETGFLPRDSETPMVTPSRLMNAPEKKYIRIL